MESGSNGGPPKVSVGMEVQENLEWLVYRWSKKLNVFAHPRSWYPTKTRSVDNVRSIQKVTERYTICKRNDDGIFDAVVRSHKGVFNKSIDKQDSKIYGGTTSSSCMKVSGILIVPKLKYEHKTTLKNED